MTLTTFALDTPAPGTDWSFVIPGINLVALTTIGGQLLTNLGDPNVVVLHDASGAGYILEIHAPPVTQHLMLGQSGALVDDAAIAFSDLAQTTHYGVALNPQTYPIDFSGDFSLEWWQKATTTADLPIPLAFAVIGGPLWTVQVGPGTNVYLSDHVHGDNIAPTCFIADGAWHHYVWTWDQANQNAIAFYVDGAPVAGVVHPGGYPARVVGLQTLEVGDVSPADPVGFLDEVAVYPRALTAGEVAQHFTAAVGGLGLYTKQVLQSGATGYWHLDENPTDAPRLPTLEVLNGATLLGDYPAPVAQDVNTITSYTWFADARGTPGSATPAVVTIGVPPLVLPPGYTLRSLTAGLQDSDQWQNLRLLWDDALQSVGPGYQPYAYPPGAFLEYHQEGT